MVEVAQEAANAGVLGSLGIDWKLFLAQLINFGVVAFVLWKWVFTPLVNALDKRSAMIEESLNKAKAIDQKMKDLDVQSEKVMRDAKRKAQEVFEQAEKDAAVKRDEELLKTKADVEKLLAAGKRDLESVRQEVLRGARAELADLVVAAAGKALTDPALRPKNDAAVERVVKALQD